MTQPDFASVDDLQGLLQTTKDLELPGGKLVRVRSLSDAEKEEVLAVQFAGWQLAFDAKGIDETTVELPDDSEIQVGVGGIIGADMRANRLAAAYGLVHPPLTVEQVGHLHPSIVATVGEEVRRISGIEQSAKQVAEGLKARGIG